MYERVLFYNHFGNGDIFESREFVKACMAVLRSNKYYYAHGKSERLLLDIDGLEHHEVTVHMKERSAIFDDNNGNLYINTWIGRDGKYVLPGIGCTVEKLVDMYNDMLSVVGLSLPTNNARAYIPAIDYSKYYVDNAHKYLSSCGTKMLIDNGLVCSNQAFNFDMNAVIESLANEIRDTVIITTHNTNSDRSNVVSTDNIIGGNLDSNLCEVSYVSTHCGVIVGRNSGPHVYAQVKENVLDAGKKLVSFTYHQQGSSFVVNTDVDIKKYWFPDVQVNAVVDRILEVINE